MDQRAKQIIAIVEKIGAPLVSSVVANAGEDAVQGHAQQVAALLTQSVKLGIDIVGMTDLSVTQGDSVRLALSGVAGAMLADLYAHGKKVPDDVTLSKIKSALQAVLTFSENFTIDDNGSKRLVGLSDGVDLSDSSQTQLQYMYVFISIVDAVASFSFGLPEQKLVLEITERLISDSKALRGALFEDLSGDDEEIVDFACLRALVPVFAACYTKLTKRLSAGEVQSASIDKVWKNYDARYALLRSLVVSLSGQEISSSSSESVTPVQASSSSPPSSVQELSTPSVEEAPAVPASSIASPIASPIASIVTKSDVSSAQEEQKPAVQNPMAMFSKPESDPQPDVEQDNGSVADEGDGSAGSRGNPMSFFKKGG